MPKAIPESVPLFTKSDILTNIKHPVSPGGCWTWAKSTDKNGYGRLTRSRSGKRYNHGAHVVAYTLWYGAPPEDKPCVLHKCDYPTCVNPNHLYAGTQQDNIRDRERRNRGNPARGEAHIRSKLTEAQVLQIRKEYKKHSRTHGSCALGKKYGVSQITILQIVRCELWKHI